MQFFPEFFTSPFLRCDSNLGLQINLPRLGVWLIDLTSFFFWKMFDIVIEYWKLLKLCFIIWKVFGLLGLYVVVKGIISLFLLVFGWLKILRCISLVFHTLASINDLTYFCSNNIYFSSLRHFFHIFILNNGKYSSSKREREREQYIY